MDKTYDLIPAVKPQIAMYEQFGIPGLVAFKKTVDYCKSKGLVVIGDIKRGDIGSTSSAYAVGHIGKVQVGSKTYAPCLLYTSGTIIVNGHNLGRMRHRKVPMYRRNIGVVFQDFRLLKDRNIYENIAFAQRVTAVSYTHLQIL